MYHRNARKYLITDLRELDRVVVRLHPSELLPHCQPTPRQRSRATDRPGAKNGMRHTLHLVPVLPPVLDEPALLVKHEVAARGPLRLAPCRGDAVVRLAAVRARRGVAKGDEVLYVNMHV